MAEDKVKVVIGFDPDDRSREGKTVELESSEAHELVWTGRAQYLDTGKGSKKSGDATNNAGS